MKVPVATLLVLLAACSSGWTTKIQDLYEEPAADVPREFAFEMPEYPPHPDPAQARTIIVEPAIAVPAFGGHILGSHRGEWGGELAFRHPGGRTEVLLHEPVRGIEQVDGRYLAFVGLAHLSANSGSLYQVSVDAAGQVTAGLVLQLPGSPMLTVGVENGVFFVVFSGRFKRRGSSTRAMFDCYFLDQEIRVTPTSCDKIKAARQARGD